MAKYLSNRQKNLKVGINSYTENNTVLEVTGKVGIGTTNATSTLSVVGNSRFTGVVTATSFSGSGSNLTGIVTQIIAGTNISIDPVGGTGAVTVNSSAITGVSISTNTTNQSQYLIYSTSTGSTTGFGVSTSGLVFNPSSNNLGIATTNPTSKLYVVGDGYFTGVVTATTFVGNLTGTATTATNLANAANITTGTINSARLTGTYNIDISGNASSATYATNAGVATSVIGGIGSITQLRVTGVSTFTNGPVLVGAATSTGTASQRLQVTGGAYISGNVGIGTTNPTETGLTVLGKVLIQQDSGSNNRIILRGQPGSSYRWNIDNYSSSNEFRIFREDDATSANGFAPFSISTTGTLTATKFSGDGSLLTNLPSSGSSSQWVTTSAGIHTLSNVGIGTTNPTSKLTVTGDSLIVGVSTANSFRARGGAPGGLGVNNNGYGFHGTGDNDSGMYSSADGQVEFYSNSTEVSRITSNQNYIIGTTSETGTSSQKLQVTGGAYVSGNIGIGTTNPTSKLSVVGDGNFTGVVTASSFSGNASSATSATYATNAGLSTNLKGGLAGNIPYQSAPDTTTFLANGSSGTILQSNGVGNAPSWVTAAPAGAITGLTVRDEGTIVGGANSVSQLNFVGNIVSVASTSGIATVTFLDYVSNAGVATYASTAGIATALQNSRTFEITGDIVASPISFDGTGNVSLAATIQPNSVALGTDTTGDYVQSITGTANQITVTGGTGESSTPTLSVPNQFTAPQDVTVTRDLQVNRNLNVNGNITIGGTSATIFSQTLNIYDPDIVLGYRTDGSGNDISNDNTANHGGVAIASTEGTPLVQLFIAGIETNPATYKKIMWFKAGTFSGLGTDAWLSNYAVGIGSTQFPTGTRLAAGSVQFTENDLAVVRNINASGIITTSNLNVTGVGTFLSSGLKIRNPANTFQYDITSGAITANRTLNLPVITGTDTVAVLGLSQTFTGTVTFSSTLSASSSATLALNGSATGGHSFGSNQTSGTLTFGGTSGTGLITFGRATTTQTTDIQAGATASGNTKTINLGTGGLSGSFTNINVGPIAGLGTVAINAGTNLGIGSARPTSKLDVIGDAKFTGVVTATSFSGNASSATYASNAGVATALQNSRTFEITGDIVASPISFDGTGNVSLAATIQPNSVALGSDTTGNYVASVTNGSYITGGDGGSEGAALTIGVAATSTNTANQVVARDASGNFSAGTITANLTGTATSTTNIPNLTGDITSNGTATSIASGVIVNDDINASAGIVDTKLATISTAGKVSNSATTATDANTASAIVARDASGNFSAGTITANLTGTASTASFATTSYNLTDAANITTGTINSARLTGTYNIDISGNASSATYASTAGVSTSVSGGTGSLTQLQVTGVSTFTNGPVLIGSATSTGTTSQPLQVTGGAYVSGSTGIGTTNPTSTLTVQGTTRISGITTIRDVTIDKSIASPNATVPVAIIGVTTTGISTETNIDVVLLAKGTGATLAQVPDGTVAGGDKRGQYATDLQKFRGSASHIASGNYATIAGGSYNVASGTASAALGGEGNQATSIYSTVVGGLNNTASSSYSFVGGGRSNTAQTDTHAVVCGGNSNTASGANACVASGESNTASGRSTFIGGGGVHIASGSYSAVMGGASGNTRSIVGYHVFPACNQPVSSAAGSTQSALLLLARQTTDATATVLASNNQPGTTNNQVILPNNSAYFFKGSCIAGVTGAGNTKAWEFKGAIKRGANAAATSIVGSVIKDVIASDAGASTWDITITADTTNGGIKVEVTGQASTTIRWVCKIETTEMTY